MFDMSLAGFYRRVEQFYSSLYPPPKNYAKLSPRSSSPYLCRRNSLVKYSWDKFKPCSVSRSFTEKGIAPKSESLPEQAKKPANVYPMESEEKHFNRLLKQGTPKGLALLLYSN
jgi:hypothetical protein